MKDESGFTLIELLVALMIFAMLAAAGVMLLANSVSAQAQMKLRLDDMAAVQRAAGALSADLGQAVPRISRTEAGTLAPAFWSHREGEATPVLQFVRGGWDNLGDLPRPSLQKVEYWVRQGRLERRTYAEVDGAAGDDPAALLDHVDDVQLRFRDQDGQWRAQWVPTQPDLMPRAVEMTVTRQGEPPVTLRFLVGPGPALRQPGMGRGRMPDPGKSSERGAALLTVLLLVAVMAVIASAALERLALATRMVGNGGAVDQARAIADAGMEVVRLRIGDLIAASPGRTTLAGNWMGTPQTIAAPGGMARARVTDGGNCFNLNSVVAGDSEADLKVRPVGVAQFQALLQALGVDARQAQRVAASLADWIDSDSVPQPGGAEDEIYAQLPRPYRTSNRFLIDASELRAVNGVTPAIYDLARPWICALPTTDLSPINVNTLLPDQAPLFAMLLQGQVSVAQARQLLAQRPAEGYGSTVQFWAPLARNGVSPLAEVEQQVKLTTGFFRVNVAVDVGGTEVVEQGLIDARQTPAVLLRRSWGTGA